LQKRLNRSRWCLVGWLALAQRTTKAYRRNSDPQGKGEFWGCPELSDPLKSYGSLCCSGCENGRTDRDAVWGLTHMWAQKTCIRRGQSWTNPFTAARGDKIAMRLFVKIHLFIITVTYLLTYILTYWFTYLHI